VHTVQEVVYKNILSSAATAVTKSSKSDVLWQYMYMNKMPT